MCCFQPFLKKFILSLGKRDEFDLRMLSKLISKPGLFQKLNTVSVLKY